MHTLPAERFLARQRCGDMTFHRSRANLLLHIIAVPILLIANVVLVVGLLQGAWMAAGGSIAIMALSLIAQGRGHRLEPTPPDPFTGPSNALLRILAEQWITFPRFVFSGEWLRALRARQAP